MFQIQKLSQGQGRCGCSPGGAIKEKPVKRETTTTITKTTTTTTPTMLRMVSTSRHIDTLQLGRGQQGQSRWQNTGEHIPTFKGLRDLNFKLISKDLFNQ